MNRPITKGDLHIAMATICAVVWTASTHPHSTYHAFTWLAVAVLFVVMQLVEVRRYRKMTQALKDDLARMHITDELMQTHEDRHP